MKSNRWSFGTSCALAAGLLGLVVRSGWAASPIGEAALQSREAALASALGMSAVLQGFKAAPAPVVVAPAQGQPEPEADKTPEPPAEFVIRMQEPMRARERTPRQAADENPPQAGERIPPQSGGQQQAGGGAPPTPGMRVIRFTVISHLLEPAGIAINGQMTEVDARGGRSTWEQLVPWPDFRYGITPASPFPPEMGLVIDPDGKIHITFTLRPWV